MLSIAIFGGNRVDGSMVDPGERIVALALFGGIDMDFAACPPPPATDVLVVSVFGGVHMRVRPDQSLRVSGFSLFGGRSIEPRRQLSPPAGQPTATKSDDDADVEFPLEIAAYAFFGGLAVKRADRTATQ